MQLLGDAADNPDQRIYEDIKSFIDLTLHICIGVPSSVVSFLGPVGRTAAHSVRRRRRHSGLSGPDRAGLFDRRNSDHPPDRTGVDRAQNFAVDFDLLAERRRWTTLVSIGRRTTLNAFQHRHLALVRDGEQHRLRESPLKEATQ
jgi:ABC-type uncharacterized transport system fused permease/ATPase subunit